MLLKIILLNSKPGKKVKFEEYYAGASLLRVWRCGKSKVKKHDWISESFACFPVENTMEIEDNSVPNKLLYVAAQYLYKLFIFQVQCSSTSRNVWSIFLATRKQVKQKTSSSSHLFHLFVLLALEFRLFLVFHLFLSFRLDQLPLDLPFRLYFLLALMIYVANLSLFKKMYLLYISTVILCVSSFWLFRSYIITRRLLNVESTAIISYTCQRLQFNLFLIFCYQQF